MKVTEVSEPDNLGGMSLAAFDRFCAERANRMVHDVIHEGRDSEEYLRTLLSGPCAGWGRKETDRLSRIIRNLALQNFVHLTTPGENGLIAESKVDLAEKFLRLAEFLERFEAGLVLDAVGRTADPALLHADPGASQ